MGLLSKLALFPTIVCVSCSYQPVADVEEPTVLPIPENKYAKHEIQRTDPRQALFLFHKGRVDDALDLSIKMAQSSEQLDYQSIREICKLMIQQGGYTKNPQLFLSTLYGASIAASGDFYPVLKRGLDSPNPYMQLASLQIYRHFPEEHTKELLKDALGSRFLAIRMEAAFILASRKAPEATAQILSLMYKTPPDLEPIFPQFFALIGNYESQAILKRLLSSPNKDTRVQAIIAIGAHHRDDLLEDLYPIATHTSPEEEEATSWAFGQFKDRRAEGILKRRLNSPLPFVQLASAYALYQMGQEENLKIIEEQAIDGNEFAISILGEIPSSKDFLKELYFKSTDMQVKLNAATSLLKLRSGACIETIKDVLITSPKGTALQKIYSPSGTFSAFESVNSAEEKWKRKPEKLAYAKLYEKELLTETIDLDDEDFLFLTKEIFSHNENDLIPTLIHLLENRYSEKVSDLLTEGARSYTSPFLRLYCYLALINLGQKSPYLQELRDWILEYRSHPAIQFYNPTPSTLEPVNDTFTLTPNETSQLLIDSCLTLAEQQDRGDIVTLLKSMRYGSPINRPILAGVILKATE